MKSSVLSAAAAYMQRIKTKGGDKTRQVCVNHFNAQKKKFTTIRSLATKSGFSFNREQGLIEADDDAWDRLIESKVSFC